MIFSRLIAEAKSILESSQSGGTQEKMKNQGQLVGKMMSPGWKAADLKTIKTQRRRMDKTAVKAGMEEGGGSRLRKSQRNAEKLDRIKAFNPDVTSTRRVPFMGPHDVLAARAKDKKSGYYHAYPATSGLKGTENFFKKRMGEGYPMMFRNLIAEARLALEGGGSRLRKDMRQAALMKHQGFKAVPHSGFDAPDKKAASRDINSGQTDPLAKKLKKVV